MTKNQNVIKTPYTANELYKLAETEANKHNIPEIYREDAIAEFVAAGFEAIERSKETIRGYQYTRGRGAMLNYLKKEIKQGELTPDGYANDSTKIPLDALVSDADGEYSTLAETIIDKKSLSPHEQLLGDEKANDVRQAISKLQPNEAEAVKRVLIDGETQEQAAKAMDIGRRKLQYLLETAKKTLRFSLSKYEHEYRF